MGQKLYLALQNKEAADKIYRKWCGLGGNAALLRRAASKAYEKAKRKGKVNGIGVAPAAAPVAAWWATASPIIAALMPIITLAVKSIAPGSKGEEIAETASEVSQEINGYFGQITL